MKEVKNELPELDSPLTLTEELGACEFDVPEVVESPGAVSAGSVLAGCKKRVRTLIPP